MSDSESRSVRVKICGITTPEDALMALDAGADLLGLNFVPSSKRFVSPQLARQIRDLVGVRAEVVGVVADLSLDRLEELRASSGVDSLQLHGSEPPELLARLPSSDFKAVRIATARDVAEARRYRGPRLLVDAKVGDALGGTGHTFDWSLLGTLAQERQLILAGGLRPDNVGAAVKSVRPWAVDVASGVEVVPAVKDCALVAAFVKQAHAAA